MPPKPPGAPGRQRIIKSPDEMRQKISAYISERRAEGKPLTMCGMALALGFATRAGMAEYEHYEGYTDIVRSAMTLVEEGYEARLHEANAGGAVFALKNMGWTDSIEHRHSGSVDLVAAIAEGRRRAIEMSAPRVIEHDSGDD